VKGKTPFLLWPVASNSLGESCAPPWSYYFGPMWSPEAFGRPVSSQLSTALAVFEAAFEVVLPESPNLEFELHPTVTDVRVFDWWNFGTERKERFRVRPRYSAQIQNMETLTDEALRSSMRELRRRELRKALATGTFEIVHEVPAETFVRLRRQTIENQGDLVDVNETDTIPVLYAMVASGDAHITGVWDRASRDFAAANLVIDGGEASNLVMNVLNESYKNTGAGPLATFTALRQSRERGNRVFDFNGANSPRRGDDKHSYGAQAVLYFRVQYLS
jgi:hypothetical protein